MYYTTYRINKFERLDSLIRQVLHNSHIYEQVGLLLQTDLFRGLNRLILIITS